jgi:hypothetical protein
MEVRMVSSFVTSSSATKTPISSHGIASAKGRTGAPWGPAQWAQAEDGTLHVLIVGWWMVCRDVEHRVVLEVLPHRCTGAPALHMVGASRLSDQ